MASLAFPSEVVFQAAIIHNDSRDKPVGFKVFSDHFPGLHSYKGVNWAKGKGCLEL